MNRFASESVHVIRAGENYTTTTGEWMNENPRVMSLLVVDVDGWREKALENERKGGKRMAEVGFSYIREDGVRMNLWAYLGNDLVTPVWVSNLPERRVDGSSNI